MGKCGSMICRKTAHTALLHTQILSTIISVSPEGRGGKEMVEVMGSWGSKLGRDVARLASVH
jgi:hypothetical protein